VTYRFTKEADLGPPVIAWLAEMGADVYQEVEGHGGRADIAFLLGPTVGVVELKTSFSLEVIAQARNWLHYAHRVWIAVPSVKRGRGRDVLMEFCDWKGIGVLEVYTYDGKEFGVREARVPTLNRRIIESGLREKIRPEHKAYAKAGTNVGGHYTPFKQTCRALLTVVKERPGLTMKEAIDSIATHYASKASARSNLAAWIADGKVPGVALDRTDGQVRLVPVAAC
jgi:hypothetical protein